MDFDEISKLVECALGSDEHLVNKAFALSCGHFICKTCVPANNDFKCQKCNKTNKNNLLLCKESDLIDSLLRNNLPRLSKLINEKIEIETDILRNPTEGIQKYYDIKIDQIRDEVEVRIESMINDLHAFRDKLYKQLDDIKLKIQKNLIELNTDFEKKNKSTNQEFANFNFEANSISKLYELESYLRNIRKQNKTKPFELEFNQSDFNLTIENVGNLIFEDSVSLDSEILNKQLKKSLYEFLSEYKRINECKLLYRASVDGFEAVQFHKKCDNVPNTVTVIKSATGYVFGGFTTQTWNHSDYFKADQNAFIFSLVYEEKKPQKFKIKPDYSQYAIYCESSSGPHFGSNTIFISNKSNANNNSHSSLSGTYNCSIEKQSLAGLRHFIVSDIEVFAIDFKK